MNGGNVVKHLALISALSVLLIAAGCASSSAPALETTAKVPAPAPTVQNCGIVSISSPAKYVCNGKVYTSMQLAKLRKDEVRRYEPGK